MEDHVGFGALVVKLALVGGVNAAQPLFRLAGVIEAQIVINRLGRQHHGQPVAEGLQAVERAIAAHANQPLNPKLLQVQRHLVQLLLVVRIDIIARGTDQRATLGRFQFGNGLKEWIEMDVRDHRIEQAVEALDDAGDFQPELVGARRRRRKWWR